MTVEIITRHFDAEILRVTNKLGYINQSLAHLFALIKIDKTNDIQLLHNIAKLRRDQITAEEEFLSLERTKALTISQLR